jgi:hypothetical protein
MASKYYKWHHELNTQIIPDGAQNQNVITLLNTDRV